MLDWIFEGIVTWISSVMTSLMDAVSGLFLDALGTDMVVGVLCYTSPLAFAMGGSKETNSVFRSWCRMVGSQLILLIMNVWFLRAFGSSVGQFIGNGKPVYDGENVKTVSVETVRYRNLPAKRSSPAPRRQHDSKTPKKKT